jgi:hypothetical protein
MMEKVLKHPVIRKTRKGPIGRETQQERAAGIEIGVQTTNFIAAARVVTEIEIEETESGTEIEIKEKAAEAEAEIGIGETEAGIEIEEAEAETDIEETVAETEIGETVAETEIEGTEAETEIEETEAEIEPWFTVRCVILLEHNPPTRNSTVLATLCHLRCGAWYRCTFMEADKNGLCAHASYLQHL